MLETVEEQVPERWDDEFDEAPKNFNYERDFLLLLQTSPLCQEKPTFLIDVDIILHAPHDPTNPLDPSRRIDLMLCKRITNRADRPTFQSKKTKFDNWWAQKQIGQEQMTSQQENIDTLKPDWMKGNKATDEQNGPIMENEEDMSACEEIIYNCVESVLNISDTEDDVNNNELPQPEEKKAQEISQNELVFDNVKNISYPSRNLAINMAIISRRRMSSSMRVGSSRLKRISPPCRPSHPSMKEWKTTEDIPYHLFFDDLMSSGETDDHKTSSSCSSRVLFGSRKVLPGRTNLVSVSKDLLGETIDPEVIYRCFEEWNCSSKTPENTVNDTSFFDENLIKINDEDLSPKHSINEFVDQENTSNNYLSEELPSTNDIAITPSEEKTAVVLFEESSETKLDSVPEHCHQDYVKTTSNRSEQNTEKNDNEIVNVNEEKVCDITDIKVIPTVTDSTVLTDNEGEYIVKDTSEKKRLSHITHKTNLIEELGEPDKLNDDFEYPVEKVDDKVSHGIEETVCSGMDNPDTKCRQVNTESLVDCLEKLSIEEFVELKDLENNVRKIEELICINENLTMNSATNITSDRVTSNEGDIKAEDVLLNSQLDTIIKHSVEEFIDIENLNNKEFKGQSDPKETNKTREVNVVELDTVHRRNHEGDNSNHKTVTSLVASIKHNVDTLDDFDDDISVQGLTSITETKEDTNQKVQKSSKVDSKQKNNSSKTGKKKQQKVETGNNDIVTKNQHKLSPTKNDQQKQQKASTKSDANKSPQKNNTTKTESSKRQAKQLTTKKDINNTSTNDINKKENKTDTVRSASNTNRPKTDSIKTQQLTDFSQIIANPGFNTEASYSYDDNESHEEWQCQRKSRRKRTSLKDTQSQSQIVNNTSDRTRSKSECLQEAYGKTNSKNVAGGKPKGGDEQLRYTPSERADEASKTPKHQSNTNFPVTNNRWRESEVRSFCSKNYVMYILRGIPGCGKTTVAQEIKKCYSDGDVYVCSAGNVRYIYHGNGHFEQDASEVCINQSACHDEVRKQCLLGKNIIIIDDIHMQYEDFQYYLQLAHHNDYIVNFIEPDIRTDIDICFNRNKHEVPKYKLEYMKSIYEELIAYYYGWCISLLDTLDLRGSACHLILSHSSDIPAFRNFIYRQNIHKIENLFHIYHMNASSSSKNILHVTSCYTNSGRRPGSKNYARSKDVLETLGRVDELQIIGLCITQMSLFARVLLSEKQKLVWGNNDSHNGEINRLHKECYLDNDSISEHVIGKDCDGEDWHSKLSPQKLDEHVNKIYNFIQNMEENYLLPDYGIGCTAHITLGVVDGFGPVTSRENLKAIIMSELNERPTSQYTFSGEMVRCYGDNLWVMYFKESITIPAMFCGTYFSER